MLIINIQIELIYIADVLEKRWLKSYSKKEERTSLSSNNTTCRVVFKLLKWKTAIWQWRLCNMYQAWDLDMNKPRRSLPGQETVLISGFILEGNHRMMNICSMWITFHNFYHAVLLVILNIYYLQTIWFISGLTRNFIFKPYLV